MSSHKLHFIHLTNLMMDHADLQYLNINLLSKYFDIFLQTKK